MNSLIGRRRELSQIKSFLRSNPAQRKLICLHGPGGIGKTAILRTLRDQYRHERYFVTTDVIDLVEARLSKLRGIRTAIATQLDPYCEAFTEYFEALNDLDQHLRRSADAETIRRAQTGVELAFRNAFAALGARQHIIIFLDTLEILLFHKSEWETDILPFLGGLPSTSFIVAGRDVNNWRPLLTEHLGDIYELSLPVLGLAEADARRYFELTPVGREIDNALREKLYLLTNGRPILMDLAIEWLRRELPFKSLKLVSANELRSAFITQDQHTQGALLQLPDGQFIHTRTLVHEFESEVIENILELPGRYKLPILAMACLQTGADRWLLTGILDHFFPGLDPGDQVISELKDFTFVKVLPDERLVLHDEARRMITQYRLWERYDGTGEILRELLDFLVAAFGQEADKIEVALGQTLHFSPSSYAQIEQIAQELSRLRGQQLEFALHLDTRKGFQLFLLLYKGSRYLRLFPLSEVLLDIVNNYVNDLDNAYHAHFELTRAQFYFDSTNYERAEDTIHAALSNPDIPLLVEIDLLILRGNIETRRGRGVLRARQYYQQALDMCRESNLREPQPKLLSELGYLFRSQGNLREAVRYYEQARQMALDIDDRAEEISVLIRWSIVDSRIRNFPSAYEKLRTVDLYLQEQSLPDRELVGRYYSALGENLRYERRYQEAIQAFDSALQQFTDPKDQAWPGLILSQRGIAYLNQYIADASREDALANARSDLISAVQRCREANKNALPTVLHRLGRYYQAARDYKQAIQIYREGAQLSRRQEDWEFVVEHLVSLSEVLSYEWRSSKDPALVREIEKHRAEIDDLSRSGFRYPHLYGKLLQILGNILLVEKRYPEALDLYVSSIPQLREQEMFVERDRLDNRLREIEDLVLQMPDELQSTWWRTLYDASMKSGFAADQEVANYLRKKSRI